MSAQNISKPGDFSHSCVAAYENLLVWADLLDAINVFPVADGDTGTNLRISLSPLRGCEKDLAASVQRLSASGVGNSGNIAAAFLSAFLQADQDLSVLAVKGQQQAYQAVYKPVSGTMLDVFDALVQSFQKEAITFPVLRQYLQEAVANTANRLAALEAAGVVDSGALGMFLFFDGFFQYYLQGKAEATPLMELFGSSLQLASSYHAEKSGEYCVELVLKADTNRAVSREEIADLGDSVVVVPGETETKVHLHTKNPDALRTQLAAMANVVSWSDEAIDPQLHSSNTTICSANQIRIITDAAASLPLSVAREHGIILLDSYILSGDHALPESLFQAEKLYSLLRKGEKISTAQASTTERNLHYAAACAQHEKLLYICTGSAFTGNYAIARNWQKKNAVDAFEVLDSGAASGRLAVIALLTARFAETGATATDVIAFAKELCGQAEEFVFIDELKYLVAGGRVSKSKAFFADLLHMKPVISPHADGVRKVAVVRNRQAQIDFCLGKLAEQKERFQKLFILLQYSDNKELLEEQIKPLLEKQFLDAEIMIVPLSLTSGVHMGPGTWSLAYVGQ